MNKLKNLRKILVVLVLLIVTISFSACSSIRNMTIENKDGTIDELVYVTLNTDEIIDAGYNQLDIIEMKKDIENISKEKAEKLIDNFKGRLKVFPFIDVGVNIIDSKWENNTYAIGLRFDNLGIYQLYYGIDPDEPSKPKETKEFLYTRYEYKRYTKYYVYQSLYEELKEYYDTKYPEFIDNKNNEILYTYVSDTSRLHSDANYIIEQDDKYYHTWVIEDNKIDDTITMYYKIANRGNWLILCIIISLLFSCLMLLVSIIIKTINYNKNKKSKIFKKY